MTRGQVDGLSPAVRMRYRAIEQITYSPDKLFEWKLGSESRRLDPATQQKAKTAIHLFVLDNISGVKIPLLAHITDTIDEVKVAIVSQTPVTMPARHMKLSWHGKSLEGTRTVLSYGIEDGQCLHISRANGIREPSGIALGQSINITVCILDDSPRPMLARLRVQARLVENVGDLKRRIEGLLGVPISEQRLIFNGSTVGNERTLLDIGVRDEDSNVQLVCPFSTLDQTATVLERNQLLAKAGPSCIERSEFPVVVREVWPWGSSRRVDCTHDGSIRSLKERLAHSTGISPDEQLLLYRGRVLQNDLTANYYNIEGGACIDLAVRGGVAPATPSRWHHHSKADSLRKTTMSSSCNTGALSARLPASTGEKSPRRTVVAGARESVSKAMPSLPPVGTDMAASRPSPRLSARA
eukprot:gnl/TRDRNA2_/TRDRNA2_40802_c0_seq1.p1 gnl/TRDRNA2_/TRDRNA2_40802_c0~~gnl/TRDRNA2_/TRDRNA2_40802_c0_seq1.p1  ORF type:complete len:411 (-),score=52.70 gnl/TRDRNA2_/TRDRNA2_40802_c0_seq1:21-1253(-)